VPIRRELLDARTLHTILSGRVTDEELLAYYQSPMVHADRGTWREVVDGSEIAEMAITPEGQRRLAALAAGQLERLRGGRVAMVARTDFVYGMFRMWELQREGLGYEVQVFRDLAEATAWVQGG
jgi:hypothetical protein